MHRKCLFQKYDVDREKIFIFSYLQVICTLIYIVQCYESLHNSYKRGHSSCHWVLQKLRGIQRKHDPGEWISLSQENIIDNRITDNRLSHAHLLKISLWNLCHLWESNTYVFLKKILITLIRIKKKYLMQLGLLVILACEKEMRNLYVHTTQNILLQWSHTKN